MFNKTIIISMKFIYRYSIEFADESKNLAFPSLLISACFFNLLTISLISSGKLSGNGQSDFSVSSHSDDVPATQRDLPESNVSRLHSSSTFPSLITLSIAASILLSFTFPVFLTSNFCSSLPLTIDFLTNFLSLCRR